MSRLLSLRPRAALLLGAALVSGIASAQAEPPEGRFQFSMYGRVGVAWTPSGRFILGRRLNLTDSGIGGRLEEADYLEPTFQLWLLRPPEGGAEASPSVRMVLTPVAFAGNGLLLGFYSNGFDESLDVELAQAYLEASDVGVAGLRLWMGSRFLRGDDVHIADYYYFNDLSGQGAGASYGPLDVAVLLRTHGDDPLYAFDSDGDGAPDGQRLRTQLAGQYTQEVGAGHSVRLLGELHLLPEVTARAPEGERILRADQGWVLGVKGELNFDEGVFNRLSVRYGRRIANGSLGGARTWATFGRPDAEGRYPGAQGIEVVNHFVYDASPVFGLDVYGTFHQGRGASGAVEDEALDFALHERLLLYVTDGFHLAHEVSFQGLRVGEGPLATAVKLSLMPTLVPTGKRSVWARPHFRFFYTVAFYDRDAVATLASGYLREVGATSVAHYLGLRVEWWLP